MLPDSTGMIRRILEFCHWSRRCSPRRPGRLVVTATVAPLNLLTGGNSSRPWRRWNPKQRALWGVWRGSVRQRGLGIGGTKLPQLFLTPRSTFSVAHAVPFKLPTLLQILNQPYFHKLILLTWIKVSLFLLHFWG